MGITFAASRARHRLASVVILPCIAACSDEPVSDLNSETATHISADVVAFDSVFRIEHWTQLEQTEEHLIVSVAHLDVSDDGLVLIADRSEGNVKLYTLDGELEAILGRRGAGPGEFRQPRRARFSPDGSVVVADASLARLETFDLSGEHIASVRLSEVPIFGDFGILSDGRYVFLVPPDLDGNVLVLVDSLGRVVDRSLPIGHYSAEGISRDPQLQYPRQFSLAIFGDTIAVTNSLTASVWLLRYPDGVIQRFDFPPPSYAKPILPPASEPIRTGQDVISWFLSRHLSGYVHLGGAGLGWTYIRGPDLVEADEAINVYVRPTGEGFVVVDAPPTMTAYRDYFVAVENPATDDMALVLYTWK